ncbi:MAG TPA: hypothetical protein VFY39_09325, partial [Gammaproteobacteria bacterium]|nr:hypothetical protein [Gammaproteobacteria bacterium]
ARLLQAVEVQPVDETMGREAGLLLARSGTDDPIDATVVLVADRGDRVLTSDPRDITHLAESAGKSITVIAC